MILKNFYLHYDQLAHPPIHYAFADKKIAHENLPKNNIDITKTNDILLDLIDESNIEQLRFRGTPFLNFIEIMEENNLDLYHKLMAKLPKNTLNAHTNLNKAEIEEVLNISKKVKDHMYTKD